MRRTRSVRQEWRRGAGVEAVFSLEIPFGFRRFVRINRTDRRSYHVRIMTRHNDLAEGMSRERPRFADRFASHFPREISFARAINPPPSCRRDVTPDGASATAASGRDEVPPVRFDKPSINVNFCR